MIASMIRAGVGGLVGGPASLSLITLIASRSLSRVAMARASGGANYLPDGSIEFVAENVPRWNTAGALLIEGQRTNMLRNARFEGAAPPTTNPLYGNFSLNPANGVSLRIVGTGIDQGFPYLELEMAGTATANGVLIPTMESSMGVPAETGQNWSSTMYVRHLSGTPGYVSSRLEPRPSDAGNVVLAGYASAALTADSTWRRITVSGVLTASGIAYLRLNWRVEYVTGRTYLERIRIAIPTLANAPTVSTPIISPAGEPAQSTRAADMAALVLNGGQQQRGTLVGTFVVNDFQPAGNGLLCLDNGTQNNRLAVRALANGTFETVRVIGGTVATQAGGGAVVAGTPFRAALAWDRAAGTYQAFVQGIAGPVLSGGLPPVSRLLVGHDAATLASPLFGGAGPLDLHATRLPDAQLVALTA